MRNNCKAFVQLGLWKNPKWTAAKLLEKYEDGTVLVETHGLKIVVDSSKVKKYERIDYDFERHEFTKLQEFININWENLKYAITDSMNHFFPNENLVIDEKDKIIYALNNSLSIGGGIFEKETIIAFLEVPEWSVVMYKTIPSTRYQPEDVDEVLFGHSANNTSASKIFIDAIWNINCEGYWENKHYEGLTQDV